MDNKTIIGFVILLVFASSIYVTLNNDVRIRVDHDKSTFYVQENSRWVVSGREYNRLFDGSSIMYRQSSKITIDTTINEEDEMIKIVRTTPYIRGPVVVDTYLFDGKIDDVRLFPISHTVEVYNATGYFYRYSVDELVDVPSRRKFLNGETSQAFGRNMKVEWESGYKWAWLGWPYGSDSMAVQYYIQSNYENFSVRLFDPPQNINLISPTANFTSENQNINFSFSVNYTGILDNCSLYINDTINQTIYGRVRPYNYTSNNVDNASFTVDGNYGDESTYAVFNAFPFSPDSNMTFKFTSRLLENVSIHAKIANAVGSYSWCYNWSSGQYIEAFGFGGGACPNNPSNLQDYSGTLPNDCIDSEGNITFFYKNNGTSCDAYFSDIYIGSLIPNITTTQFDNEVTLDYGSYNWSVQCVDNESNSLTSSTNDLKVNSIDVTNFQFYALNRTGGIIGGSSSFNTSQLIPIEYMNISFTVDSALGFADDITLRYTADGTSGCSLGNRQTSFCYNYDNSTYQWIVFKNGTTTTTFKDEGTIGDYIDCNYVSNGGDTQRNYTCQIDEHYNPNVMKWYSADYNFSDVKWQSGASQRLSKTNYIRVNLAGIVPLDADQYKLDFRVQQSVTPPTGSLSAYACNASYTTGDPITNVNCLLIASKTPTEISNNGGKFRAIFTKQLVDTLGVGQYIALVTDEPNNNRYYALKTMRALNLSHPIKWDYSINNGASWTTNADGYETEMNINWFYDGVDPTTIKFMIETDDGLSPENSSVFNMTWDIDATNNYPPIVTITSPENGAEPKGLINITWNTVDANDNNWTTNVTVSNGTDFVILADAAKTVSSTIWNSTAYAGGNWNITVQSCENDTIELYCGIDTHSVFIDNPPLVTGYSPLDGAIIRDTTVTVNINVTDDFQLSQADFYANYYGPFILLQQSYPSGTTAQLSYVFPGITEGEYLWKVVVTDNASQTTTEGNHTLIVAEDPIVTIVHPVNGTTYIGDSVDLNWTVDEDNLDTCTYNLDGTGDTFLHKPNCFQEFANVSTSCGGLSTGTYTCSGTWSGGFPCSNTYDGDYNTYGQRLGAGDTGIVEINYTKPVQATGAIWQYKLGTQGTTTATIPNNCFDAYPNNLVLRMISDGPGIDATASCYNSTDWISIDSGTGAVYVYEEAIYWTYPFNITLTNLSNTWHNISITCNDTYSSNGTSDLVEFYMTYAQVEYGSNCQTAMDRRFRVVTLTEQDLEPSCQGETSPLYNITNAASVNVTGINIKLTEPLVTGIQMECAANETFSLPIWTGVINLTQSEQLIYNGTIEPSSSVGVWCRIDLNNPTSGQISDINFEMTT